MNAANLSSQPHLIIKVDDTYSSTHPALVSTIFYFFFVDRLPNPLLGEVRLRDGRTYCLDCHPFRHARAGVSSKALGGDGDDASLEPNAFLFSHEKKSRVATMNLKLTCGCGAYVWLCRYYLQDRTRVSKQTFSRTV